MKIISWNVNGIRSAQRKGFLDFLQKEDADIICLQELKAHETDLPSDLLNISRYRLFLNPAQKRGYSGVAVYTKIKPKSITTSVGHGRFDSEGRILELAYPQFTLVNVYIPHGGRQKENLGYKLEVYDKVLKKLNELKNKNMILIGDFNIAHEDVDLARPAQNRNNIMFSPEERQKLNSLLDLGFIDSFRTFNKETGNFTWWPYAFDARKRNMGWRIDYGFVSQKLSKSLTKAVIYSNTSGSDHCPIGLEINLI